MVVSGREIVKLAVFVVLIGLAIFYVASNRERLIQDLTGRDAQQPSVSGRIDLGTAEVIPVASLTSGRETADGQTGGTSSGQDLFVEFRLERDRARSEQFDLLREVLNNQNLEKGARDQALAVWLEMTQALGREVDTENLIRAKGFADAVVVLREGKATIMVKAASLTLDEVLRIADIAVRVAAISFEDIIVLAREGQGQ